MTTDHHPCATPDCPRTAAVQCHLCGARYCLYCAGLGMFPGYCLRDHGTPHVNGTLLDDRGVDIYGRTLAQAAREARRFLDRD
jgi:hypothetical protein